MRFIPADSDQDILDIITKCMLEEEAQRCVTSEIATHMRTVVNPTYGILYVDHAELPHNWLATITSNIKYQDSVERTKSPIPARYGRAQVISGDDGFTSITMRPSTIGTKRSSYKLSENLARNYNRFIWNQIEGAEQLKVRDGFRFVWIVRKIESLLRELLYVAANPSADIVYMLHAHALVYDPNNIFARRDGIITIKNSIIAPSIYHVTLHGHVSVDHVKQMFLRDKTKVPEQIANYIKTFSNNISQYTLRSQHYIPCIHDLSTYLIYCGTRQYRIEILRQLTTRPQILSYDGKNLRRICFIELQDVRECKFNTSLFRGDKCTFCDVPLYDDIYITFAHPTAPTGTPYCAICAHATYTSNRFATHYMQSATTIIDSPTTVVARTKYPRTVHDVIKNIQPDVQQILRDWIEHDPEFMHYNDICYGIKTPTRSYISYTQDWILARQLAREVCFIHLF